MNLDLISQRLFRPLAFLLVIGLVDCLTPETAFCNETIQVTSVEELTQAIGKTRGHTGERLDIVLAKGEYKIDRPLEIIGANQIYISAKTGATIISTSPDSSVFVIAYCDDIELQNLTIKHDPNSKKPEKFESLIQIHQSKNVRLKHCTLEFATTQQGTPVVKTSKAVENFLGSEIIEIVANPDQVLSYQVNPRDDRGPKMLGSHEITAEGPALTPKQNKILTSVILDENTYDFKSAKRGLFSPQFGFKFVKGKQEVILLVDAVYSQEVIVVFDGKELREDCDHAKAVLQKLTSEIFTQSNGTNN